MENEPNVHNQILSLQKLDTGHSHHNPHKLDGNLIAAHIQDNTCHMVDCKKAAHVALPVGDILGIYARNQAIFTWVTVFQEMNEGSSFNPKPSAFSLVEAHSRPQ